MKCKKFCGIIAGLSLSLSASQAAAGLSLLPTTGLWQVEKVLISKTAIGTFVTLGCMATVAGLFARFWRSPAPTPVDDAPKKEKQSTEMPPDRHYLESLHPDPDTREHSDSQISLSASEESVDTESSGENERRPSELQEMKSLEMAFQDYLNLRQVTVH